MLAGAFEIPGRVLNCQVDPGATLMAAAEAAGVVLNVACAGTGRCGGCAVDLLEGGFTTLEGEAISLDGRPKRVLGCRTRAAGGPFRVRVPAHSLVAGN
jgi:ferredoxin